MANLISTANGNLTAAATWGTVTGAEGASSPALIEPATVLSTTLSAASQNSQSFTPAAVIIDGVSIKLASRAAGTPTNTMTVTLFNVTTAAVAQAVTVNVSDLAECTVADLDGGWYFFKFAATHTPNGTDQYQIRVLLSATTTAVALWRDNTVANWLRMLRTTTTGAPAAGTNMHVMGEFDGASNPATTSTRLVVMDSVAATDYGSANIIATRTSSALSVCNRGTVVYDTVAATAYILRLSGNVNVYSGGDFHIGDTGAEMPRDSSAVLEFDCTADAAFGLMVRTGGAFTAYGLSRTVAKDVSDCRFSASAVATDTTLNVDADTGWLSGDEIGIAPTGVITSEQEQRTLNANAGATSMVITAGLTNGHLGAGDYFGEIVLLTRNVRIRSTSATFMSVFDFAATTTIVCSWVSFRYMSSTTAVATIRPGSGAVVLDRCVVADGEAGLSVATTALGGTCTLTHLTIFIVSGLTTGLNIAATTGAWLLTDLIVIRTASTVSDGVTLSDVGGTIGNLSISGAGGAGSFAGLAWLEAAVESANGPTQPIAGTWRFHSNGGSGFRIGASTRDITFPRTEVWHNAIRGLRVESGIHMENVEFDGGFWLGNGAGAGEEPTGILFSEMNPLNDVRFRAIDIAADTLKSSHWGVLFDHGGIVASNIQFIDCNFSQTSGTRRQVSVADIGCIADVAPGGMCVQGIATNCTFNSSGVPVSFYYAPGVTPTRDSKYSHVRIPMFGGVATAHRTYSARGTFLINTSVFDVTPSLEIQPIEGAAVPVDSNAFQPGWGFLVPVLSGQTVTVSVKVQKSAGYNGSTEPQLVLLANPQIGIASDAVIDTLSIGSGSFETLTGVTAAASADGVMEFIVRCYGTAGSIYVDTWSAA